MLIDKSQFEEELAQALEYYKKEMAAIRSGKAQVSDLEEVQVEAYGGMNPLNSVGQVIAEDAMTLKVSVWDKGVLPHVEKALRDAELGGGVSVDKDVIRVKFMPMTEEDRTKRVKQLKDLTEQYRVRVRQVRQKFMKEIDDLEGVSEDDQERDRKAVQQGIDKTIEQIDTLADAKEQDLMNI